MENPIKQKQTSSTRGNDIVAPALFYAAAKLQPCKQTEASASPRPHPRSCPRPRPPSILACLAVSTVVLAAPIAFLTHETYKEVNIAIKGNVAAGGSCCDAKPNWQCPSEVIAAGKPCIPIKDRKGNVYVYPCAYALNYVIEEKLNEGYKDCSDLLDEMRGCPADKGMSIECFPNPRNPKAMGTWSPSEPPEGKKPEDRCKRIKYVPLKLPVPTKNCNGNKK